MSMGTPKNSSDRELPDGDQQQEAFLDFAREVKVTATKLQLVTTRARTRLGGRENWHFFHVLEHTSQILNTISSGMLDFSEEEHLESVDLEQGKEVGPPILDPGTGEWVECFLSLSESINSLATDITTSVARIREISEQNEEIFSMVESAANIIQNVCSLIDDEVGYQVVAAAFADGEYSLEELLQDESDLDLPASGSTSREGLKRGTDAEPDDDEPQQKVSKLQ